MFDWSQSGTKEQRTGEIRPSLETLMISLPTRLARDWKGDGYEDGLPTKISQLPTRVAARGSAATYTMDVLPTRTAQDATGSGSAGYSTESGRHSGTTLSDAVLGAVPAGRTGKLNPQFVEWTAGLPATWTDCVVLATPLHRSKPPSHGKS